MRKNGFTIIEVVVVFLLLLGVSFFILPKSLDTTRQAKLISKWTQKYSQLQYMFSVINAQNGLIIPDEIKANQNGEKKKYILEKIKPYLRISSEVSSPKYKIRYMNKSFVLMQDKYYFSNFYNADGNEIVGLKWLDTDCKVNDVCALMFFDVNGIEPPNAWGYDVYGIDIMKDSIQPMGKNEEQEVLKNNCSKGGFGIYCSYYYLIGGEFDN